MIIEVNNIRFDYKSRNVLNDVSFDVNEGEILAVMGPNGVGKSTLLKCIDMILKPSSGSVLINNSNLNELSKQEIAKNIGYVSQRNETSRISAQFHTGNLLSVSDKFHPPEYDSSWLQTKDLLPLRQYREHRQKGEPVRNSNMLSSNGLLLPMH